MVDCSHFSLKRYNFLVDGNVDESWLADQPRCTTKSGWITYDAHHLEHQRSCLQVLVCKLAITVMKETFDRIPSLSGDAVMPKCQSVSLSD